MLGTFAGGDRASPSAASARADSASRSQPIRSASRPIAGPAAPRIQSTKTRLPTAGPKPNGGGARREEADEKQPAKGEKKGVPGPGGRRRGAVRARAARRGGGRSSARARTIGRFRPSRPEGGPKTHAPQASASTTTEIVRPAGGGVTPKDRPSWGRIAWVK